MDKTHYLHNPLPFLTYPYIHSSTHTYSHPFILTLTIGTYTHHTYLNSPYILTLTRTYLNPPIHTFTNTYSHSPIHSCTHPYILTFNHTYLLSSIGTYIHPYIHSPIHTYTQTYIQHPVSHYSNSRWYFYKTFSSSSFQSPFGNKKFL